MHAFFPGPLRATAAILLVTFSTVFWGIPIHAVGFVKLISWRPQWRDNCTRIVISIVDRWIGTVLWVLRTIFSIEWDIRGTAELSPQESYILCSNHQTWTDIPVLLQVFTGKIPFFRIFAKKQMLWLPIIGTSLLALDYPVMKRYSKEYLKAHPEKRGRDLETTRRMCQRYQSVPVSILVFAEGTRFNREKHARQQSPYRYLLKPKSGGLAFALTAMEGRIRKLLDVTILYPEQKPRLWRFLCGDIRKVIVCVRQLEIPEPLLNGDYRNDARFRETFKAWLGNIWADKDDGIHRMRSDINMRDADLFKR